MTFDDIVAESTQTCMACPTQYEGVLADGRSFYFRYRWGTASLGFGSSVDEAVQDSWTRELDHGEDLDGYLDEDEYKEVFLKLYEM